ncbi:MAG: hypothetical protein ACOCWW_02465, partial [Bacteroidota bacterium]
QLRPYHSPKAVGGIFIFRISEQLSILSPEFSRNPPRKYAPSEADLQQKVVPEKRGFSVYIVNLFLESGPSFLNKYLS